MIAMAASSFPPEPISGKIIHVINPHYSYVTGFDKSRQIIYNNRIVANCMHAATSLLEIK